MKCKSLFILSLVALLMAACTSKTAEQIPKVEATKVVKPKRPTIELSQCKHWVGEIFETEATELHVLYRDQMKAGNYEEAFPMWKQVYEMAPAADGQRDVHYIDGAKIYKHFYFYKKEATAADKEGYKQRVMGLYQKALNCYPKKASSYKAVMAYDYFYTFPGTKSNEEIYQMYKEIVAADDLETSVSVLNPFTSLIVNLLLEEKIPMTEAQTYAGKIMEIFNHNKKEKSASQWKKEGWDIVESYAPARLEQLEGIEGFYDCAYFKNKYFSEYEGNKSDCDIVRSIRGKLNWAKCSPSDPQLAEVNATYTANCRKVVTTTTSSPLCREYLENGNYLQSISCYEEKAGTSTDIDRKAQYYLVIAKIYYGELKKFSKARQYARKAIQTKPNWGEPYILIGKLYASSGPLCGPGTGWDSQIVTWPAIDKWQKAKSVDSSVAAEANKLINRYRKYMPSVGDIFQRSLTEGASFKVKCWIQESTTIRAAPKQ